MELEINPEIRKAAILIDSLDRQSAQLLLGQLNKQTAESVRQQVHKLTNVTIREKESVLAEFLKTVQLVAENPSIQTHATSAN